MQNFWRSAIHLMMVAREESVKWILVHCWVYLNDDLKKKYSIISLNTKQLLFFII